MDFLREVVTARWKSALYPGRQRDRGALRGGTRQSDEEKVLSLNPTHRQRELISEQLGENDISRFLAAV